MKSKSNTLENYLNAGFSSFAERFADKWYIEDTDGKIVYHALETDKDLVQMNCDYLQACFPREVFLMKKAKYYNWDRITSMDTIFNSVFAKHLLIEVTQFDYGTENHVRRTIPVIQFHMKYPEQFEEEIGANPNWCSIK